MGEGGLADPRHVFDKQMSIGQQAGQGQTNPIVLAEYPGGDRAAHVGKPVGDIGSLARGGRRGGSVGRHSRRHG